jgi:hypothetical protein
MKNAQSQGYQRLQQFNKAADHVSNFAGQFQGGPQGGFQGGFQPMGGFQGGFQGGMGGQSPAMWTGGAPMMGGMGMSYPPQQVQEVY